MHLSYGSATPNKELVMINIVVGRLFARYTTTSKPINVQILCVYNNSMCFPVMLWISVSLESSTYVTATIFLNSVCLVKICETTSHQFIMGSFRKKLNILVEYPTMLTCRMTRFERWTFDCPISSMEYPANVFHIINKTTLFKTLVQKLGFYLLLSYRSLDNHWRNCSPSLAFSWWNAHQLYISIKANC